MADVEVEEGSYSVTNMVEDKYIGLIIAMLSSICIGMSFILTKLGLNDAAARAHERTDGRQTKADPKAYLQNPIWWAGMLTMAVGEIANFTAYAFAPPILVTPLGALSVLIGAVLASIFLKEELGRIGTVGCALCLLGSLVIVLHAPADKEVKTVDEFLSYAAQPGFMCYALFVTVFSLYMIYKVCPKYGNTNPLVYLSICSLVGSISVMAIKGLGVALKLTFSGNNQLTHLPTYLFAIAVAGCIMTQMNYFNKALDTFSTNVVNPIYYVMFSSSTIFASLLLFKGLNTTGGVNTISLLCGFLTTFLGVYLLNLSRSIPSGQNQVEHDSRHRRRVSHTLLETGMLNPRISISSDRIQPGSDSFEDDPGSEDESYPLRNKNARQGKDDQQQRNSISNYNHQYAAATGPDTDHSSARRSPEVVFDIGNDDEDDARGHGGRSPRRQ